jgi:hypothetical protein
MLITVDKSVLHQEHGDNDTGAPVSRKATMEHDR